MSDAPKPENDPAEAWVFSGDDETSWTISSTVDALRLRNAVRHLLGADV
jgi:hypothetical protein